MKKNKNGNGFILAFHFLETVGRQSPSGWQTNEDPKFLVTARKSLSPKRETRELYATYRRMDAECRSFVLSYFFTSVALVSTTTGYLTEKAFLTLEACTTVLRHAIGIDIKALHFHEEIPREKRYLRMVGLFFSTL